MEELTIEEKAKRYDEAIERAEKWRNAPNVDKIPTFANRVIDEIFPEFEENEDERIRKVLVELISTYLREHENGKIHDVYAKNILAWLDKQGEKNTDWSEEDEREIEHCIDFLNHPDMIRTTPTVVKGCKNWLKSLRPQNTWKPSDEQIMALRWVLNHIPYDSHKEEISGLLEQLKKLREE